MDDTLAMAGVAATAGIRTIVATPHIRDDHPLDVGTIPARVAEVSSALAGVGIAIEVVPGGELSVPKSAEMDDEALGAVAIADGPYLLVESPYTTATDMLENALFALQVRGFRPVLAHPERSPSFLADIDRLGRIVDRGVLCSVTAASMYGRFGRTVRGFTREMFRAGLVHDVASDAHDPSQRRPELLSGFEALDADLRGLAEQAAWYTEAAPGAMLRGEELPERPDPPRGGRLRRLLARG